MASNHSIEISRTISPTVTSVSLYQEKPSTAAPKSNAIKHRYYVDTSDIIYMLKNTSKVMQTCSLEAFQKQNI